MEIKIIGKIISLRFIVIIFLIVISSQVFSQNLLNFPESVVFDQSHNRYLVSNVYQGKIVEIDSIGAH